MQFNSIVIPFSLPWEWSADYQKQTCLELAKKYMVIAYTKNDAHFFLKRNRKSYPRIKNILFFTPVFVLPFKRFSFIEKANHFINFLFLIFFIGKRFEKKLFWIFDPYFNFLTILNRLSITLYDCVDYFTDTPYSRSQALEKQECRLIKSAHNVFVNSKTLLCLHDKWRKDIVLVPQGFRLSDFLHPQNEKSVPYFRTKGKPVIGFVGALNDRLDFSLLFQLIKKHPEWHFIFWGKVQKENIKIEETSQNINKLLNYKNVTHGHSKNRKEIPEIIKQFDIGTIPYDIKQPSNVYCYPMKLFEYFYCGKPVVATPIKELFFFKKNVEIASNVEEWEVAVRKKLKEKISKGNLLHQQQIAAKNSWELKVRKILNTI